MITQSVMGDSFNIDGFGTALLASVIMSLLNALIQRVIVEPLQNRR
jgi:putative membrane protein